MEKLKQIKENYRIDRFGIVILPEEFNWLVEQAEKVERYEKALADIRNVSTLDEYEGANPKSLLKACYDIAKEATS